MRDPVILYAGFQSTLPYAGSDVVDGNISSVHLVFQSTLPYAGSDYLGWGLVGKMLISIHAPLCGERPLPALRPRRPPDFNPRSPMRGATVQRGYRR